MTAIQRPRVSARNLRISRPAVTAKADSPVPPVGGASEEAATPGQPSTRRSAFREPSQQLTLENCWAPPALSRCSSQTIKTSCACVSAMCRIANRASRKKSLPLVQKLWRTGICCGKQRKSQFQIGPRFALLPNLIHHRRTDTQRMQQKMSRFLPAAGYK